MLLPRLTTMEGAGWCQPGGSRMMMMMEGAGRCLAGGNRMVPAMGTAGWCQPGGNEMVPGRFRTPGSSAPEPGACGRETAAQKDQTLQMFLSRVPV